MWVIYMQNMYLNAALQYLVRILEDSVAQTSVVIRGGKPITAAT